MAASAGNVYVVETHGPGFLATVKRVVVGKEKVDLSEQVSGLKTQKKILLEAVEGAIGEVRKAVEDLQSKAQAVKNSSGNEQYTRDFTILSNNYTILKEHANNQYEAYLKVLKAYEIVMEAYNELLAEAVVSTDLRVELHHKIITANQLVKEAETVDETKTTARRRV
jgi:hypothetical protein